MREEKKQKIREEFPVVEPEVADKSIRSLLVQRNFNDVYSYFYELGRNLGYKMTQQNFL